MINTYLDYNIFVDLIKSRNTINLTKYLKTNNINYFYSPAHIEEFAHADLSSGKESTNDYFDTISKITNNNTIRPLKLNAPLSFYLERPQNVYQRVRSNNGLLKTSQVETIDYSYFSAWSKQRKSNIFPIDQKNINNISPDCIFFSEIFNSNLIKIFNTFFYPFCFCILKQGYQYLEFRPYFYLEGVIESLLKILQFIGYHSDNEKSFRSATHDISHALYATKCNIFVTNDKKFSYRIKAVYSYMGVQTDIMNFNTYFNKILS